MERANEINTYNNIDTFEYDLQEMKYQECLTKELEQKVPQQINQDIINGIVILILEENEQAEHWLLLIGPVGAGYL